ncbi:MAG TPA: hypothetical protein VFF59_13285, partial [Anaerolineae bacterium]|nr:hypothetical protein [Anaerolineae bacterium]
ALGWEPLEPQVRQADRVYFTRYSPDRIELVEAGRVMNASGANAALVASFGDGAVLEKADWSVCADRLQVRLVWRAAPGSDWHVFVHLLKPDGTLAAQHDSPPLMGLHPFWQWSPGERVEDVHPIDLAGLPRDRAYTISVGLYDPANGERLIATLPDRAQPADRAVRIGTGPIGPETCR